MEGEYGHLRMYRHGQEAACFTGGQGDAVVLYASEEPVQLGFFPASLDPATNLDFSVFGIR